MSAINIIVQRDAAHVITDGAKYLANGELAAVGPKCQALPHLPALLTQRGPAVLGLLAEQLGSKFATFDDLVEGVEVALREIVDEYQYLWQDSGQTLIELMFVGWSNARSQFESYAIRTEAANDAHIHAPDGGVNVVDTVPFALTPLPPAVMAPILSAAQLHEVGMTGEGGIEQFDPIGDGRRLLEAQRAIKVAFRPEDEPMHHCGGFAMLSTVTRTAISQRVFHRWPDVVGEPINKDPITDWAAWRKGFAQSVAAPPDADRTAGMSRLKRQMLEKKLKKGKLVA